MLMERLTVIKVFNGNAAILLILAVSIQFDDIPCVVSMFHCWYCY